MIHKENWEKITLRDKIENLTDDIQTAIGKEHYERCIYYDKDEFHNMLYHYFGLTEADMKNNIEIELFDDNLGEYIAIVSKSENKGSRIDATILADPNYVYRREE